MAADSITSAYCHEQFRILQAAVAEWDESEDFYIQYENNRVKAMSQDLADSIESFLDNTADAGRVVEKEARANIMAIDPFYEAYVDFKTKAVEENPLAPPYGSDWLWREYRSMIEHFDTKPSYPKPLPIKKYIEQSVGPNQIAVIFGWKTPDGAPDVNKVSEEVDQPGTHYDPATWVHPAKVIAQAMVDRDWAKRKQTRQTVFDHGNYEDIESTFVPPSLDEMVRVGAPAAQISNIHKITIEEAEKLLIEAGTLQGRDFMPASPQMAHLERINREQASQAANGLAGV